MYRVKEELRPYKPLDIKNLPEDVQNSIDRFISYLNTTDTGFDEDIYRAELDSDINWYTNNGDIDPEISARLKRYYVHGEIYNSDNHNKEKSLVMDNLEEVEEQEELE